MENPERIGEKIRENADVVEAETMVLDGVDVASPDSPVFMASKYPNGGFAARPSFRVPNLFSAPRVLDAL